LKISLRSEVINKLLNIDNKIRRISVTNMVLHINFFYYSRQFNKQHPIVIKFYFNNVIFIVK